MFTQFEHTLSIAHPLFQFVPPLNRDSLFIILSLLDPFSPRFLFILIFSSPSLPLLNSFPLSHSFFFDFCSFYNAAILPFLNHIFLFSISCSTPPNYCSHVFPSPICSFPKPFTSPFSFPSPHFIQVNFTPSFHLFFLYPCFLLPSCPPPQCLADTS